MALKTIYLPDPAIDGDTVRITGDEHHHLTVGRAEPGELIEIFDGRGQVWTARVAAAGKRETVAQLVGHRLEPAPRVELALALALIRAAAFELALEKAVEAGVTRIIPFAAARSNVAPPRRQDRWHRIIVEAAKQSKRYHLPVCEPPATFEDVLRRPFPTRIVFAEQGGERLSSTPSGAPILYAIGPEGGWTEAEAADARAHGFRLVTLGRGILRSETAAIAGAIVIRHVWGDL